MKFAETEGVKISSGSGTEPLGHRTIRWGNLWHSVFRDILLALLARGEAFVFGADMFL